MPIISNDSLCFWAQCGCLNYNQVSTQRPVYGMLDHSPIHFRDSMWSHRTNAIMTDQPLNELIHVHEPRRHEERSHGVSCEYNKIMTSGTSETKGLLVIAVYHILYCNYQFNMLYIICLVVCLAAIGTDLPNVT